MAAVEKKEVAELIRLNGKRIDLKGVEASLMQKLPIRQCAVVAIKRETGETYLAAFVVMEEILGPDPILSEIILPEPVGRIPVIPLPNLPRKGDGTVDKRQLADFDFMLPQEAAAWEQKLRSVQGIGEAAVVIRELKEPAKTYHITDLLPSDHVDTAPVRGDGGDPERSEALSGAESGEPQVPWAFAYGGELAEDPDWPRTLPEALRRSALEAPDKGVVYIRDGRPEEMQTYPELLADAERILGGLRSSGLGPRDPVILQFADNRNFISALWACFLGGIIPTPVAVAPVYSEMNGVVRKLHSTWELLERPVILTDRETEPRLQELNRLWNTAELRTLTAEFLRGHDRDGDWYEAGPEDPVLHLLSSGSTGLPKCIRHRHRSLLARMKATAVFNGFTRDDVSLNWMPLDHVGGVVMFHIRDVFLGCQQIKPDIDTFIANPLIWLDWIDRYKATLTWAPNFAFALVNEREREIGEGTWDLSSMRYIMNAGEAVVARTAQRFLRLLKPLGLSETAMVPAYGMSETSSAITQSKSFRSEAAAGVRIVDQSTLSGNLREVYDGHPDMIAFTEVGVPIPTVSVRIVDERNNILRENKIGRLQAKGPTIMDGYYRNPEANREVFVGDGWFNTGDLGFLHQGRLCITGREKDVIIINGANYLNYEIEAIVEEIAGVEVTFSAACGISGPEEETDRLAIFFVPSEEAFEERMRVVQAIRQTVVRRLGIQPQVVLPVEKSAFPKTNSGKIQRAELKKRYLSGEFAEVIKKMDLYSGNDRTLPAWFFQPVWRAEKAGPAAVPPPGEAVLIFADELGLSEALNKRFAEEGRPVIQVRKGTDFARTAADAFVINPGQSSDYAALFETIRKEGTVIGDMVHVWTYDGGTVREAQSSGERDSADRAGILSLLYAVQAAYVEEESPRLTVATAYAGSVTEEDVPDPGKAALTGLLKTLQAERGNSRVLHLDLELDEPDENAWRVYREMRLREAPEQVAYRNGERLVPRLLTVDPLREAAAEEPLEKGAAYLITGGLGGIGLELARFLLVRYQAKLLLIGRSSLNSDGSGKEKSRRFAELAGLGDVRYEQADVCSLEEMRQAMIKTENHWQIRFAGVFHLAGSGSVEEHLSKSEHYSLQGETEESFLRQLDAKVLGARTVSDLFRDRPEARLVFFSSVNGYFGGSAFGAYSTANAYMDAFVQSIRKEGRNAITVGWSMWQNIGMSTNAAAEASAQKGFRIISKSRGIHSLQLAMRMNLPQLLVGLDGANRWIRPLVVQDRLSQWAAAAYYTGTLQEDTLGLQLADETGKSFEGNLIRLDSMPYTGSGGIDRAKLPHPNEAAGKREPVIQTLSTEWEQSLARIWQEVLECESVSTADNFFDLGGHSLKATKVISRINHEMGMKVPLQALFQYSTLGELAVALEEMRPVDQPPSSSPYDGIPRLKEQAFYELSHAQRRVWFLCRMEHRQAIYNILGRWEVRGPLNPDNLQAAFGILADRHQALRSTFAEVDGKPQMRVLKRMQIPFAVVDLSFLEAGSRNKRLEDTVYAEAERNYDLEQGPLMAVTLVKLEEGRHELLIAQHHLISDGWSLDLLIKELGQCYESLAGGRESPLSPLPVEWTDFTVWQNQLQDGNVADRTYWLNHLKGELPSLNLPADHPRKAVQTYNGATEQLLLKPDLLDRLAEVNQRTGTTMYMLLLASFNCMLYKLTGQTDLIVGTPIAGRDHPASEPLVGMFVNTLALRTRIEGNPTFRELLEQVKQTALDGQAHQHYPFDKLVDELAAPRDLSRSPVFQVMLDYLGLPLKLKLGSLDIQEKMVNHRVAKFDLSLHVFEREDAAQVLFEYNTDLFDKQTIIRWMGHLQTLLERIAEKPEARLSELSLMTDEEFHQVVYTFNRTETDFPREAVLHELFAEQVRRAPDNVAVVFEGETMTYAELDRRTTVLAGQLQALGVGPDVAVAALFDRSFEMIIGILGIVKAGGAYVPIDPEYPQARIEYILETAESPLLLTHKKLRERAEKHRLPVLCADEPLAEGMYSPDASIRDSKQLAYINFTSGSTGKPKGVMIPHVGVVRLVKNTTYVDLGPDDRMLQIVNYAFDVFSYEIWGALLNGGRLVIVPREAILDMARFSRALVEHRITTGFVPTALFNRLVESYPDSIRGARALLVGGEALSVAHTRKALEYLPKGLLNGYGPTENTTYACVHQITSLPEDALSVPIGRPLSNSTAIIVDGHGNPVPIGVTGEIYMGGLGVALGYFKDPERTGERFVPNPYTGLQGEILYKSGDLGRWLPDGTIEYLGRMDTQVKIRGYRIECGEIESTLLRYPGVEQCVVVPRADAHGHKRLIGYVVAPGTSDQRQWKAFLQETLPDYMVPAAFVAMESLPLNSNGKVDKNALPEPVIQGENGTPFAAPRNEWEERIAAVWREVLGLERISIHDSFFDLGGDSLLSIQVVARLNQQGIKADPKLVFLYPTLAALAERLATLPEQESGKPLTPQDYLIELRAGDPEKSRIFFAPPAGGTVMGYIELARRLQGGVGTVYALQSPGLYEEEEPRFLSYEELVLTFLSSIEGSFRPNQDYLAGHSMGGHIAFGMCQELVRRGTPPKGLMILDTTPALTNDDSVRVEMSEDELKMLVLVLGMGNLVGVPPERLKGLDYESAKEIILEEARKDEAVRRFMSDRYLDKYLKLQMHNLIMSRILTLQPMPVPVPLYVFKTGEHPPEYEAMFQDWHRYASASVEFIPMTGNHVTMMRDPHVRELAERMQDVVCGMVAELRREG